MYFTSRVDPNGDVWLSWRNMGERNEPESVFPPARRCTVCGDGLDEGEGVRCPVCDERHCDRCLGIDDGPCPKCKRPFACMTCGGEALPVLDRNDPDFGSPECAACRAKSAAVEEAA